MTLTFRSFDRSKRGIALISVLAMVMLLTALVVAFMLRVGSEKQASGFYRAESTARSLSDTVLNIVEGEINEATTQGITYSWASQPGAIRVFDNTGAAYKIFKLYSSNSMAWLGSSGMQVKTFLQTKDLPPATWYSSPGTWVDLNAPVNTDPNPNPTTQLGNPSFTHFPVLDPRDPTKTDGSLINMDGFSITSASTPYDVAKVDTNGVNPAPMPVQWMYLLQNGTTTTATGPDASGNYTFVTAPSTSNPIIGRMAFWTDDETCKVNVNTAAGDGTITSSDPTNVACGPNDSESGGKAEMFWSTPYFWSTDDLNLAVYQPFQGEFQRYPGHPGSVSFNNILNSLGTAIPGNLFYNNPSGTPATQGVTPRYTYNAPTNQSQGTADETTPILALSSSRLYPTVAEMLFQTNRNASVVNAVSAQSRQQEETGHFFLTAHSRAPELNLFGLPRVAIWPISYPDYSPTTGPGAAGVAPNTSSSASAIDKLIGFDSSIGTNPYYFSRVAAGGPGWYNPGHATGDQSATTDINIPRNVQLLTYLDNLTQTQVPGYGTAIGALTAGTGGSLGGGSGKYPLWGMHQILTEIFDYIRITDLVDSHFITYNNTYGYRVSTNDTNTLPLPYGSPWEQPFGYAFGSAQVVPSYYTGWTSAPTGVSGPTTGVGTLPVLTEVTIHIVALGDSYIPKDSSGNYLTVLDKVTNQPMKDASGNLLHPHPNAIVPREWLGGFSDPLNDMPQRGSGDLGILNSPIPFDGRITTDLNLYSDGSKPSFYGEGIVPPSSIINTGLNADSTPKADGTRVAFQCFIYTQWLFPAAWHSGQNLALTMEISGLDGLNISNAISNTTTVTPLATFCQGYNSTTNSYYPMDGNGSDLPMPTNFLQFCSQPCEGLSPGQIGADHMRLDWAASQGVMGIAQSTGYYPSYGMVGSQTSNRLLSPTNPITDGNGFAAPNQNPSFYYGSFPFYSSVFTVDRGALSNPMHLLDTNIVVTASKPLQVKLYRGSVAGPAPLTGDPNLYATYNVQFPSQTNFPFPTVNTNAFRIIGTQQFDQGDEPASVSNATEERWWSTQETLGANIFFDSSDVVQSMVLSSAYSDARMLLSGSSKQAVPSAAFTTAPGFGTVNFAHSLISTGLFLMQGAISTPLVPGVPAQSAASNGFNSFSAAVGTGYSVAPYASPSILTAGPSGHPGAYTVQGAVGDWDNGIGGWGDGPWINKSDEGSIPDFHYSGGYYPYFTVGNGTESNYQALFSPNKEIPSPGMFGSLPTGVPNLLATASYPAEPWQTLLFRPGPGTAGLIHHPGEAGYQRNGTTLTGAPPDHVLLDLFWMPVAEPYANSEPFSTAGKINLNYQIVPFTYIKRATAIRAALASERIAKCPASDAYYYKKVTGLGINYPINASHTIRLPINLDETTSQFDTKFSGNANAWDLFHSASQICDIFLVPKGTDSSGTAYAASTFPAKWYDVTSTGDFALVGDNVRERPYTDMYQKVTTKSNTYTVYYRVQALKEPAATMALGKWNETLGSVSGEYRGSTTVERFIDVNEGTTTGGVFTSTIPDPASSSTMPTTNLEGYYKWRVVENHQFAP